MPILKITAADILRSKTLEPNWYRATIKHISDLKTSKAGDSLNVDYTFVIEGTEGKEITRTFNSKAIGMIIPLHTAVTGGVVKPEDFNLNTDEHLGKKLDVKVVVDTYEGQINNKIQDFLPYGLGGGEVPF